MDGCAFRAEGSPVDAGGRLATSTDSIGNVRANAFDAAGRLTGYTLTDPHGKLLSETAPEKEVSAAFRKMADLLVGPAVPRVEQKRKRGFLEKVFRMERSAS